LSPRINLPQGVDDEQSSRAHCTWWCRRSHLCLPELKVTESWTITVLADNPRQILQFRADVAPRGLPTPPPRQLLDPRNVALGNYSLYPISGTSDPVQKLAVHQRQQAHDGVRPSRYQRVGPVVRGLDGLPHFEPVVGHGIECGTPLHHTQSRASTVSCYAASMYDRAEPGHLDAP